MSSPAPGFSLPPRASADMIGAERAAPVPAQSRIHRWAGRLAAGLLALYALMSFTASLQKGVSFDEGMQLAIGYNLWVHDDYRIEGGNGDLIKRWATLPYLVSRPKFSGRDDPLWQQGEAYGLGHRFFFELGNRPESLLAQGRAMIVLLGVLAGWLVFVCAREIFGPVGGLISLTVFAFSPHMLAFGGIVSTDMSISLTLLASTWCIWRLLHEITWLRVLGSLLVFGLLLLAKPTALVILPVTLVLIVVKLAFGRPLVLRWRDRVRSTRSRRRQLAVFGAMIVLHGVFGWSAIWAHYGFRYLGSPDPANPAIVYRPLQYRDGMAPAAEKLLSWSRETHFFPEGFRRGINRLINNDEKLGAFMSGRWKAGGWVAFFPYAIAVKMRPALMLLLGLGAWMAWRVHRASSSRVPPAGDFRLYATIPYCALIVVYLAVAMSEEINLGHRHVLPIHLALDVLVGSAALLVATRAVWGRVVVAALLLWGAADSLAIRPHYLAYFGPQAGGPANGYRRLVDSSLDWGMNLPGLKRWLDLNDSHQTEPLFLAYFGTDSPDYYGIKSHRLPGFFDWRPADAYALTPGLYAISATLVQSVYGRFFGPWNRVYEELYQTARANIDRLDATAGQPEKRAALIAASPPGFWETEFSRYEHLRFARLCAWLRHQGRPPHHVGYAIFIWKLDQAALTAALLGPPVELEELPATMTDAAK